MSAVLTTAWIIRPWESTSISRLIPLSFLYHSLSDQCRPPLGPLFAAQVSAIHALAVDDAGCRACLPFNVCTTFLVEGMMDGVQRAFVPIGGTFLGNARHWKPVLSTYVAPFSTSRIWTYCLVNGIRGSSINHASAVRSLGSRSLSQW